MGTDIGMDTGAVVGTHMGMHIVMDMGTDMGKGGKPGFGFLLVWISFYDGHKWEGEMEMNGLIPRNYVLSWSRAHRRASYQTADAFPFPDCDFLQS